MSTTRRRRGFIVLVVMIVIVMITLAGLSFVLTLSTENKAVHRQGDQLQLDESLASGMELLKGFCSQSARQRSEAGGTQDNEATFGNIVMPLAAGAGDAVTLNIVSPGGDRRAGETRFGLQNESARLHLAVLTEWERRAPGSAAAALLQLPGMSESTAAAILDWIDADGDPRPGGAEAEYYASQRLPYEPRNGVPALLEELLLVRDVSRQALFGEDADSGLSGDIGPRRTAAPAVGREDELPWARLLTVYSAERNTTWDGKPRINLNHRDLRVLHAQLTEALERPWADFVVAYRQFGPSPQAAAGRPKTSSRGARVTRDRRRTPRDSRGSDAEPPLDFALPPKYDLQCVLDLVGAAVALPSKPKERDGRGEEEGVDGKGEAVSVLYCPLEDNPQAIRDQLPRLAGLTTTTDRAAIQGRVNVNEAPRCVLLGVPGLDAAVVDRILSLRTTSADGSDPQRQDAVWLLTEGLVDRPGMKALWPYVTGGGDVFRAQIVARRGGAGRTVRATAIVDATTSPPRQVYWKNESSLDSSPDGRP